MGILPMRITGVSPVDKTGLRGEGVPPARVSGILPALLPHISSHRSRGSGRAKEGRKKRRKRTNRDRQRGWTGL